MGEYLIGADCAAHDGGLAGTAQAVRAKLASDPQFAADAQARLRWWFDQSKYTPGDNGRYPIVRVWQKNW